MTGPDPAALLRAHDTQLRTDAPSAVATRRLGPLHVVTFPWGQGWVTHRDLDGADAATIRGWVGHVVDHFRPTRRSDGSSGRPGGTTTHRAWRRRCSTTGSSRTSPSR